MGGEKPGMVQIMCRSVAAVGDESEKRMVIEPACTECERERDGGWPALSWI